MPNQPRNDDVILGGQNPAPVSGVLGGLEGVKRRLASAAIEQQFAALSEALKYGEAGLDLLIQVLKDESGQVAHAAFSLLRDRAEPRVKQALQEYTPLLCAVGMNYTKLRDLLATGKWLEADKETAVLMLRVCGREKDGWLRPTKDIDNFPCQDLHTIDQLWVNYSYGRFGLSVQECIWQSFGGTKFSKEAYRSGDDSVFEKTRSLWCNFGEQVGWWENGIWKGKNHLTFALHAPEGHLPIPFLHWHYSGKRIIGFVPSKVVWGFGRWLTSGFGTEGDGTMAGGSFWVSFLLFRLRNLVD
jgi:hypothetical protein